MLLNTKFYYFLTRSRSAAMFFALISLVALGFDVLPNAFLSLSSRRAKMSTVRSKFAAPAVADDVATGRRRNTLLSASS